MHIELIDGPFQMLIGHWHFRALAEQACKVELRLDYAFSNKVLEKLVGPVFDHIANTFIERFVQRAEALYAPRQ
jgi:ribosome-associated toxin RatA of RatAB toxin-antitoxin module